ncbi:type II toxin-antitoxin system Phd/YefM family antitoxin [Moraxella oblonga]|uniref:type II toxin-antitoxin system Phd/YefM family antitoxin n=1 Tax=Moraxella oblonga TaxID=200413 RepID=UPI000A0139E1|nr:type II toxin-antitoxin system Phd/YefM family antitoxin [Moraxella oblonga]
MQSATPNVNIHYAKTHLSALIDEVASTGKPIIITKAGTPKVKIVPIDEPKKGSMFGFMLDEQGNLPEGFKEFSESFDELNDEMVELMLNNGEF